MRSPVRQMIGSVRDPLLTVPPGYTQARGMLDRFVFLALPVTVLYTLIVFNPVNGAVYRVAMLCLGAGLLLFVASFFLGTRVPKTKARIDAVGPVQFVSRRMAPAAASGMLLFTAAQLLLLFEPGLTGGFPSRSVGGTGLSNLVILGVGILGLSGAVYFWFQPRSGGVTLDAEGVRGEARSTAPVAVLWQDLSSVEILVVRGFKIIRLTETTGGEHLIRPTMHGSDPVIVAETIAYFLAHPERRAVLDHPLEALALVGDFGPAKDSGSGASAAGAS